MKKIIFILLIFPLFISCGSDDNDSNPIEGEWVWCIFNSNGLPVVFNKDVINKFTSNFEFIEILISSGEITSGPYKYHIEDNKIYFEDNSFLDGSVGIIVNENHITFSDHPNLLLWRKTYIDDLYKQ